MNQLDFFACYRFDKQGQKICLCYQSHAKKSWVGWSTKLFIYVFIYLFIYLTGEKKVNPALYCPSTNQLKREKTVVGRTMTLSSHELCIIILLEPVKVDIKRTQTKNKTIRKYWIIILFMNVKRSKEIFSVVSCYIQLYKK